MKQWQQRVYDERAELMDKYTKLKHFLVTASVKEIELDLLKAQADIMAEYIQILDRRMARW